ncbi:trypsin-like serine peptidase [Cellulomonas sp. S1-8]|uniref:trypsin-like serine peptidase n=1 Tax=Cellulomonas sp. S1-8 TaxID=2904790 RepID=UPI002242FE7D|nr:hypothetical protein [Cellulomonas sp. S1-8]UZN03845.1 hypothetical protein OKX07_02570 [Cellulomonas sp. S1-8]
MRQTSSETLTTLLDTTVVGQPWQSNLTLGAGVDAVTGQLRASAVKPFTVSSKTVVQPEYQYSFVQSESDVQSLVSASLKASYNLEGVTLSASTSFLEELSVSDLSVTLVAEVSVQQSQYSLAPSYELAVTPGPDFREKYGDYFVAGYRGGSSMYVVYQCRFTSSEQRTKFAASLGAEMPQVFSVDGSTSFEKIAKEHSANINIRIRAQGVSSAIPDPPVSGWTADSIVSVLVPWFNSSMAMEPLESYLQAYRLIDPSLSGEVPVSPDVFAQLGYLYNRFWVARAYVKTCPDFGRRPVEDEFAKLQKTVEANQASLPTDVAKIEQLTADTQRLLAGVSEVQNRQSFYMQAVAAAGIEPAKDHNFDADNGQVRWGYGFQRGDRPGVSVTADTDSVEADWKIGWREHVFSYRNSSRVLVGWDVVCNRSSNGGDWHKVSDTIIGRNGGDVYVKSDYDRGYSWTITWYSVDASLYPVGPWTKAAVHGLATDDGAPTAFPGAEVEPDAAYWTPERMRAAQPVAAPFETTGPVLPDVERSVTGISTGTFSTTPASEGVTDGPTTGRVPHPQEYPQRTVGKLFFVQGGRNLVASAFVVHTSGLMTAAHCLVMNGQQSSKITFVPAYDDGHAPFGTWEVVGSVWTHAWEQHHSPAWDVGFCAVGPDAKGRTIGDAVGWASVGSGQLASAWNGLGYPAVKTQHFPFDGEHEWQSQGARLQVAEPSTVAKWGDLSGGASGGPWFITGTPIANGLNSWNEPDYRTNVSPEFAAWVGEFYHHVFG